MSEQTDPTVGIEWIEPEPVEVPAEIEQLAGGSRLLGEALVRRGFHQVDRARAFLDPACYSAAPAEDLPDLDKAVERIQIALQAGEVIGVWGDFDVDGQTSTTMLVDTLRSLGGRVQYHIPVRATESHGINLPNLKTFLDGGVQLVLTCDTGVTAHDAAGYARARGIDMLITDHHSLPPELPEAYAVVNPQRLAEGHPLRTLPGAGTAYKLVEALTGRANRPEIARRQLDLAALGIIADVATLTGDARYLAQLGLNSLRSPARLGLETLFANAETNPAHLTEEHIGFVIGPRLNALGRLDDANPIVDFLTSEDTTQVRILASKLEGLNATRKMYCDQVYKAAQEQIERDPSLLNSPVLILSHPSWPAGVIGIVASRLVDLYQRPAILMTGPPGENLRGSARSVEGVNITAAIAACQDLLIGFGGHPMAAGLALPSERLPELRRRLGRAVAGQMEEAAFTPKLPIDAFISLAEVNFDLVESLERLAPFGAGNPAPMFAARSLVIKDSAYIGKTQEHLKLIVEDPAGSQAEVIWWQGDRDSLPDGRFDLAFTARASDFRGQQQIQTVWVSARKIEEEAAELTSGDLEIIDLRGEVDPARELRRMAANTRLLIWEEGENLSGLDGKGRAALEPSSALVIWSIPPSRAVLQAALQAVDPQKIYLCGVAPGSDQPIDVLKRISGLVRYALREKGGEVDLLQAAAVTGQHEMTIQKGIEWLAARGSVRIIDRDEKKIKLREPGSPNKAEQDRLEAEIRFLLQETAAFRNYFLQANPANFITK